MKSKLLVAVFVAAIAGLFSACASQHESGSLEKVGSAEALHRTIEATVVAVDHENREVSLKGPKGRTVTIDVDERVKNLPQVQVGDLVTVEFFESVAIQAFSPDEVQPGTTQSTSVTTAKPGEKPAGLIVEKTTVVSTIEAIDIEKGLVTLKTPAGQSKTAVPRNPENLKKVKVGDKVMVTYIGAIGISVTEQ